MTQAPNRFDLLRLVFAGGVFLYHGVALSGLAAFSPLEIWLGHVAEVSIQGFFIVSGALVYGSWERSRGLADYAGKRVRRLYPAYLVVILIPFLAAIMFALASGISLATVWRYLAANLVFLNFLQPDLPGMFEANRFSEVNGALWTLKIEVMFYLVLPLLAWVLKRLGKYWWTGIGVLIIGAFIWREAMTASGHVHAAQLARQLPGQMMYFASGMALWKLWPVVKAQASVLLAVGVLALGLSFAPSLEALRVLGMTGLVAGVAFVRGPAVNAARWGDVSYGVYITHFPILQALVTLGVFAQLGLVGGMVIATFVVIAASFALWWLVEKPALRKDSHYRVTSEVATP